MEERAAEEVVRQNGEFIAGLEEAKRSGWWDRRQTKDNE